MLLSQVPYLLRQIHVEHISGCPTCCAGLIDFDGFSDYRIYNKVSQQKQGGPWFAMAFVDQLMRLPCFYHTKWCPIHFFGFGVGHRFADPLSAKVSETVCCGQFDISISFFPERVNVLKRKILKGSDFYTMMCLWILPPASK